MDTKEYLLQVNNFEKKIENGIDKLASLRAKITRVTSSVSYDAVSCSKEPDKMTVTVDSIEKTKTKLNSDADKQILATEEIIKLIVSIENPNHRRVLYKKYIQLKTWGRIALEMGYTYRGILNLHNKAVENIKEINKSIDCSYEK